MKVSLITVCFNAVGTIRTALESVARQRGVELDYLVIDGGSTDGTVEILHEYGMRLHGRMRWVSERDRGMYDAINKGIRMAAGDVVGILNADDFLQTDQSLADIARAFQKEPSAQAIYADIRFIAQSGTTLEALRTASTRRYYSARHWKPWMLRWGFMPPHPGLYIRRENFAELGCYEIDYKIAADYELIIRYFWKAGLKAVYLNECLVGMRMGGKSTRGWRSNLLLNQEIVRGNRENGCFCCLPMLVPKYLFKIWEFI